MPRKVVERRIGRAGRMGQRHDESNRARSGKKRGRPGSGSSRGKQNQPSHPGAGSPGALGAPLPPSHASPGGLPPSPHRDAAKAFIDQVLASHSALAQAMRQEFQTAAHTLFDVFTDDALKHFNQNVLGYRFFADTHELSLACVPGYAQLPPVIQAYARASGAYNTRTRELELDGGFVLGPIPLPRRTVMPMNSVTRSMALPSSSVPGKNGWMPGEWRFERTQGFRMPLATPRKGLPSSVFWRLGERRIARRSNSRIRCALPFGGLTDYGNSPG